MGRRRPNRNRRVGEERVEGHWSYIVVISACALVATEYLSQLDTKYECFFVIIQFVAGEYALMLNECPRERTRGHTDRVHICLNWTRASTPMCEIGTSNRRGGKRKAETPYDSLILKFDK